MLSLTLARLPPYRACLIHLVRSDSESLGFAKNDNETTDQQQRDSTTVYNDNSLIEISVMCYSLRQNNSVTLSVVVITITTSDDDSMCDFSHTFIYTHTKQGTFQLKLS